MKIENAPRGGSWVTARNGWPVRARAGEVEVLLVLERLGGRAVRAPVLLVLVELLEALEDDDGRSERGCDAGMEVDRRHHGNRRRAEELCALEEVEAAVVEGAPLVVPADLVLEAFVRRVVRGGHRPSIVSSLRRGA